ncbi:hypothetical protein OS493_011430 [Desmophyllum pertusum]|uniref:C-type lectin domain-containing protein n=1 Tax=Desmophyllum pertusum TaxID=174260 RepID=A0A9W9YQC5_9CNID|nr:hypothetical protein OS493_011430 [Desmophyllum pertusum]
MAKFVKQEGVALENHVITTVTATEPFTCSWQCVDTPLCFSMNVRKLQTGLVTCELNNSSKTADRQDLMPRAGSQYHQMAEVDHCTVEDCIYKDALPAGWYKFGSKLIKLFPERRTWGQARHSCQLIGGDLMSINREDENEFISHLLGQIKIKGKGSNQITAHWILDGTDNDVSLINGATYEEEDGAKSLHLNGSGEYATTPAVDFGKTSFTIASWVKLQTPVTSQSTIYSDWSPPRQFIVDAYSTGELLFGGFNNKGLYKPWFAAGSPPIGNWFHVAAVWDRDANEARLFLDAQKVGTQPMQSDSYLRNNSHAVYDIGLKRDTDHTLRGYLRDLMIIGGALTGEELTNITDPNNEPLDGVWIGLNDVKTEGAFYWPDGSHVTYTKWASNQPDNQYGYQDCVEMRIDKGTWDDTSCGRQLPFVCEKKT